MRADKILVLYEGAIVEQGKHEELVERRGMYYELVQKQLSAAHEDRRPRSGQRAPRISYAGLIERIEILRSTLRWSSSLERPDIEKLLRQASALRDEVMQLSHKERFVKAAAAEPTPRPSGPGASVARACSSAASSSKAPSARTRKLLESLEIAEKAAPTDLPVLIDGESGTGKELMAKVIHANGDRAPTGRSSPSTAAPFPRTCWSPSSSVIARAHSRARRTTARASSKARTRGTIFLDEIGELPLSGQVKLLRVLEAHEIQRVGSDEPIAVDTRIVAATNRNLRKLCEEGRFREDLFYRLSVIHVTLPPLRERKDEIPLLFDFFGDEAAEALKRRPIEMSRPLRAVPAGLRLPGQHPRTAQHHLPYLVPGRATRPTWSTCRTDIRPAPPARDASAAPGGDGHAAGPAALGEAKRAASDEAEREFLERGLARSRRRGDRTGRRYDMNRSHVQTLLKKHGIRSKDCRNGNTPRH